MIPKFRAWLKDTKQMIDVEFIDLSHTRIRSFWRNNEQEKDL